MDKEIKLEEEVNLTLNSLDGIQQAEANPYLSQKISARLNENVIGVTIVKHKLIYTFMILLIIIMNIVTLVAINGGNKALTNSREEMLKTVATDYSIIDKSYNY